MFNYDLIISIPLIVVLRAAKFFALDEGPGQGYYTRPDYIQGIDQGVECVPYVWKAHRTAEVAHPYLICECQPDNTPPTDK